MTDEIEDDETARPVRTSPSGTRYVLVPDLFLEAETVARMERASRAPDRGSSTPAPAARRARGEDGRCEMGYEPYRCANCNERIEEGTGRFYECCALDLCAKCRPYHGDLCPVSDIECWDESDEF